MFQGASPLKQKLTLKQVTKTHHGSFLSPE